MARISPESTREPTLFERLTVRRLGWRTIRTLNRWLEVTGKFTTGLWVVFVGTIVLGVNWKQTVEGALNSGRPVRGAIIIAVVVPTLAFVAARSMIGFGRWRLQRELWRRDVERLSAAASQPPPPTPRPDRQ